MRLTKKRRDNMLHFLSKTAGLFIVPSNLLLALGIFGLALLWTHFARMGYRLIVCFIILIVVIGALPIGNALILLLEQRFPVWDASRGFPTGVVILGGGVINPRISAARGQIALGGGGNRAIVLAELARQYPTMRIVFCGGRGELFRAGPTEADYFVDLLATFGIQRDRIELESRSRNTAENAAFSKELIMPKPGERWLLVTSAMHMPRAMGAFRQEGFPVEAFPVDWRTVGYQDLYLISFPSLNNLRRFDDGAHEWFGLLAYWLTNMIPEIFPGPQSNTLPARSNYFLASIDAALESRQEQTPILLGSLPQSRTVKKSKQTKFIGPIHVPAG
jgi:uncharacterized SAM-binding protein YcdF (DUF218 family)